METRVFSVDQVNEVHIKKVLNEIYEALDEKGYKALNQMVGYLLSGDPGYISSYQNSRNNILEFDRSKLLMTILKGYLNKWDI